MNSNVSLGIIGVIATGLSYYIFCHVYGGVKDINNTYSMITQCDANNKSIIIVITYNGETFTIKNGLLMYKEPGGFSDDGYIYMTEEDKTFIQQKREELQRADNECRIIKDSAQKECDMYLELEELKMKNCQDLSIQQMTEKSLQVYKQQVSDQDVMILKCRQAEEQRIIIHKKVYEEVFKELKKRYNMVNLPEEANYMHYVGEWSSDASE